MSQTVNPLAIKLDFKFAFDAPGTKVSMGRDEWQKLGERALEMVRKLNLGEGDNEDKGVKMIGWQKFATEISEEEIAKIEELGSRLREQCDVVWMTGIGGSYLGARAVIEGIYGKNYNERLMALGLPKIYFLGADTDPVWLDFCIHEAQGKKLGLVAISKSGTTLEPALALRFGLGLIEGEENWQGRVVAITDKEKGALKTLADRLKVDTLVVPDDVGGRYSVMTAVGLLPMSVAGISVREYLAGIRTAMAGGVDSEVWEENLAVQIATWRFGLWQKGGTVEYEVTNSQAFEANLNWLMQLEPESEGHDGKGVHVVPALFPRDLHSFGQLIQQGPRNCFEVGTKVRSEMEWTVPTSSLVGDGDGLGELARESKKIEEINEAVIDGAMRAHYEGGVSGLILELEKLDAQSLGQYHYLMMKATAICGYLMGVNPFVQPGVQLWKNQLQKLLTQ